ncbi:MAG: siderophore-interacting protein [Cyanobacteria bacterium P01_F01_bin.42]
MPKSNYRSAIVKSSQKVTPNLQRVIFTGDDLTDFPEKYESGNVKLLFAKDGQALTDPDRLEETKPLSRTFTVRSFSRADNELALEFSLHGSAGGVASTWAEAAKSGDRILMGGPGPTKLVNNDADWFLLVGDMSGLPAICCNLEQLPQDAQGYAVIEIISEEDKQNLTVPEGIEVTWVVNNKTGEDSDALLKQVQALPWKEGSPYVWTACNFDSMKKLRTYFQTVRNVAKENMYISSYWKFDRTEEQHRIDKRLDAGAPAFLQFLWNLKSKVQKFAGA